MKRADRCTGRQLPERHRFVCVFIEKAARVFDDLVRPGPAGQARPATPAGAKARRFREFR
jgi:hypothetical protein